MRSVNFVPTERVEVTDLARVQEYARDLDVQSVESVFGADAAVFDGFRVEVLDQVTRPGEFAVHGGLGFSGDGQYVQSDQDRYGSRNGVLAADGTYYIEVRPRSLRVDKEPRAFWDDAAQNEYTSELATRTAPDWEIVTPVSTTGFAVTTDPASPNVPVAQLTVAAGVITGVTTVTARSVVTDGVVAGATAIRVRDSALIPDSCVIRLDAGLPTQEDVSVTANNRATAMLTLAAPLAFVHAAGARVQVISPTPASYISRNDAADKRPLPWRGDEARGAVLAVDADSSGDARSDSSLRSLKDHVDFLSAQLHELKYGGLTGATSGLSAAPTSGYTSTRYFDAVSGVLGARTASVTVGDGLSTWGDFVATKYPSADACFAAAIAALPPFGGTIYVKSGVYEFQAAVTIDKIVNFVGDHRDTAVIRRDGRVFIATSIPVGFYSITVTANGGATPPLQLSGEVTAYNSNLGALELTDNQRAQFQYCLFDGAFGASTAIVALANTQDVSFVDCKFITSAQVPAISAAGCQQLSVTRCVSTAPGGLNLVASEGVKIDKCNFETTDVASGAVVTLSSCDDVTICHTVVSAGGAPGASELVNISSCSRVSISDVLTITALTIPSFRIDDSAEIRLTACRADGTSQWMIVTNHTGDLGVYSCSASVASVSAVQISGAGRVAITDCEYRQVARTATARALIDILGFDGPVKITRTHLRDGDYGIRYQGQTAAPLSTALPNSLTVTDCDIITNSDATDIGRIGVYVTSTVAAGRVHILDTRIRGMQDPAAPLCAGIAFQSVIGVCDDVMIANCLIEQLGSASVVSSAGILAAVGHSVTGWKILGTRVNSVHANSTAYGIRLEDLTTDGQIKSCSVTDIGSAPGTPISGDYAGIDVLRPLFSVIADNAVVSVGGEIALGVSVPAGVRLGEALSAVGTGGVVVSSNNVSSVSGPDGTAAIWIRDTTGSVTVNGNVVSAPSEYGIRISSSGADISAVDRIAIADNVIIGSGLLHGIHITLTDTGVTGGRLAITGNTVSGFTFSGIYLLGNGTNVNVGPYAISITGNVLDSSVATVTGIQCEGIARLAVVGNQVTLLGNAAAKAVLVANSQYVTVSGNQLDVRSNEASARGIDVSTTIRACISGNMVSYGLNSGTNNAVGIQLGVRSFAVGNMLQPVIGATIAGSAIATGGASNAFSRATLDADTVGTSNPTGNLDIGLNIRITG